MGAVLIVCMRIKFFLFVFFLSIAFRSNAQNTGTWSGTIRLGGGTLGSGFCVLWPVYVFLHNVDRTDEDIQNRIHRLHSTYRFVNLDFELTMHDWPLTTTRGNMPIEDGSVSYFNIYRQYSYSVGYYFSWKSLFSRWGIFFGGDYEWKDFSFDSYWGDHKIHSIVPAVGLRYRLLSPLKEIEGFPFNIVLEGGLSCVIKIKYDNDEGYGMGALNNGMRTMLGLAVTTNRFGSIHFRWTKDLYNLFNNDYSAVAGPLFNNEITTNFSLYSIGWSIFI